MTWDTNRLIALRDQQIPESEQLDYKRKEGLSRPLTQAQEDLSKDVSAFANYPGGAMIFGVIEKVTSNGKDRTIDKFDGYEERELDADWIENKFRTLVDRPLSRINVTRVPLDGKFVFVVEVPHSPLAPHMAKDKRYYLRSGASSQPASHLEIEGIRHSGAPMDFSLEFVKGSFTPRKVTVCVSVRNRGSRPGRSLYLAIGFPRHPELRFEPQYGWLDPEETEIEGTNYRKCHFPISVGGGADVLFSGQPTQPGPTFAISDKRDQPLAAVLSTPCKLRCELHSQEGFYLTRIVDCSDLLAEMLGRRD